MPLYNHALLSRETDIRNRVWSSLIVTALCLTGCGRNPDGADAPSTAGPPPTIPPTAEVWFEPAALENCDPPRDQVTTIHWNASKSSALTVDVKLVTADGEGLFATQGTIGSKLTDPWMRPGSMVILRDHATGAELGRKVVGSKPCSS